MAAKTMKPKANKSKIVSVEVGPVWTHVTIRLRSDLLRKRTKQVHARKPK